MLLMRTISPSLRLALAAMSTALGVLAIYISSVLGTSRIALLFISSLMIWIPIKEQGGLLYGFLTYLATSALAYLLIPDKLYAGIYAVFFGLYGFIQLGADKLTKKKVFSFLLKFLCCNLLIGIAFELGCLYLDLDITIAALLSSLKLPLYALIIIIEAAIIAFILLYLFCTGVFDRELRKLIIKRD